MLIVNTSPRSASQLREKLFDGRLEDRLPFRCQKTLGDFRQSGSN